MVAEEQALFGRIAQDCREANVQFPARLIKQFARVARKLNEDWGKPEAAEYLQDLIFPSRPGRQGFPPEVAEEILILKNLHEERYANVLQTVWDPYDLLYKDRSAQKPEAPEDPTTEPKLSTPSIYRLRSGAEAPVSSRPAAVGTPPASTGPAASVPSVTRPTNVTSVPPPIGLSVPPQYSAMIGHLLPEEIRRQLAQIRAGSNATVLHLPAPASESELDELLVDAECLLEREHFNSGTALLEQVTTLFPDSSPFAYLRLMEIYHLIERREDFDWASQRLSEQFNCDKLEWTPSVEAFTTSLDRLAEMFLISMRNPNHTKG